MSASGLPHERPGSDPDGTPDVLGDNLRALLVRAYVPALPGELFKARVEAALLAALDAAPDDAAPDDAAPEDAAPEEAGPGGVGRARGVPDGRRLARGRTAAWRPLLAAAAVLLAVSAWWWLAGSAAGEATPEAWLARGLVAVRPAPDGRWSGLAPTAGLASARLDRDFAAFLELATPERTALEVRVPATGRVVAGGSSHASLARPTEPALDPQLGERVALAVDWDRGSLRLEHDGDGVWRIDSPAGPIALATGRLDVALADDGAVLATLLSGSAWWADGPARVELDEGATARLGGDGREPSFGAGGPGGAAGDGRGMADLPDVPPRPTETLPVPEGPASRPAVTPAEPPLPCELAGRVTHAATGEPVRAFRVAIVRDRFVEGANAPMSREFDDDDGRFSWPDIEPDTWALFVEAEGLATASRTGLVLAPDLVPQRLEIALDPGATVRGTVVDAASGWPVEGAVVFSETDTPLRNVLLVADSAPPEARVVARTGPEGDFELARLAPGRQRLRVTARGFAPCWVEHELRHDAAAGDELRVALQPAARLAGRVTRADGEPWPQAVLLVTCQPPGSPPSGFGYSLALADGEGRYEVGDLPAGQALVLMMGDEAAQRAGVRPRLLPVLLVSGAAVTLDFTSGGHGRLHGRVLDADGEPVEGLSLSAGREDLPPAEAEATWKATESAADGAFEFVDLQPGAWQIFLGNPMVEGMTVYGSVTLPESGDALLDVHIPGGRITGAVTSRAEGTPLPGAVLILMRLGDGAGEASFAGFATSRADGRFAFERAADGRYRVTAYPTSGGYGCERVDGIVVRDGAAAGPVELALTPGGAVRVTCRDREGRPVAGVAISLRDVDGVVETFERHPQTDAEGRYEARGVKPGRWYVQARAAGYGPGEQAVEIQAGVVTGADILLVPQP